MYKRILVIVTAALLSIASSSSGRQADIRKVDDRTYKVTLSRDLPVDEPAQSLCDGKEPIVTMVDEYVSGGMKMVLVICR